MYILTFYLISIFFISLILIFTTLFSYRTEIIKEKKSPFECGFDPLGGGRISFCMKFFLLGVLFLIFDVEVRLLMPLPYRQTHIILFLFVLVLGLLYEWYYGGLEWIYVNGSITERVRGLISREMTNCMTDNRVEYNIIPPIIIKEVKLEKDHVALLSRAKDWLFNHPYRRNSVGSQFCV